MSLLNQRRRRSPRWRVRGPRAPLARSTMGSYAAQHTHLDGWDGCKKQADCSEGGTIGGAAALTRATRSRTPRSPRPRPPLAALRARDRRFSSGGTRGRVDAAGLHRSRRGCAVVRVLCRLSWWLIRRSASSPRRPALVQLVQRPCFAQAAFRAAAVQSRTCRRASAFSFRRGSRFGGNGREAPLRSRQPRSRQGRARRQRGV